MMRRFGLSLVVSLGLGGFALAQTTDDAPETFTFTGPWTFALNSPEAAEDWLRDHPAPYAEWPATSEAADRGVSVASWKIVEVQFKASDGGSAYRSRARAVIEVTIAAAAEEDEDDLAGDDLPEESPRNPEDLDALEDWVTSEVTEAAVADMLAEIYDVESQFDAMTTVLTRLSGFAAARGLWAGVRSADRYISRLKAMSDRVADVKAKVTSLQDGQWEQVEDALRELGNDLGGLHFDSGTDERISYEDPFMVAYAAYEDTRGDLLGSVWGAQQHAKYSYKGDVQIAKVQARLGRINHDDTKDAVQSETDGTATRDRLKARLAASLLPKEEATPQKADNVDADDGILRLAKPSVMAATDGRAPLGQQRLARQREAEARQRAEQKRQAELARQRNAAPSQADQNLHLINLERDYLTKELERVALSPDSVIYTAVVLYNYYIPYWQPGTDGYAPSVSTLYSGKFTGVPWGSRESEDLSMDTGNDGLNAFTRACLDGTPTKFTLYNGKCERFHLEGFENHFYGAGGIIGDNKIPFAVLSPIYVLPFDSDNAFESLRHLHRSNWITDGIRDWDSNYREKTMCRFSRFVIETKMPDLYVETPPLTSLGDGSIWAMCPPNSPARHIIDQAVERTWGGPQGTYKFQMSLTQVFANRKEDLLEFASLMGPVANKDLMWFDWPAPPDNMDLGLQLEIEARLQAIDGG